MPDVAHPRKTRAARSGRVPPADLARFAGVRRLLRWLNLTVVHHGPWPLLLLLTAAPNATVPGTPLPWFAARLSAPLAAAALALVYLAQRPVSDRSAAPAPDSRPPAEVAPPADVPKSPGDPSIRSGAASVLATLIVGLAAALAVGRLAVGPVAPVTRLLLFGAADVAAFHLVHFGVVARSYRTAEAGRTAAVALFGASWAVRGVLLAAFGGTDAALPLVLVSNLVVGLAVGTGAAALGRWVGNAWLPAVAHWLVVYLVAGFAGPV